MLVDSHTKAWLINTSPTAFLSENIYMSRVFIMLRVVMPRIEMAVLLIE